MKGNCGSCGGAVAINIQNYKKQYFCIENSNFEDNFSGGGGAIGVYENVLIITGVIQNNHFLRNWGSCIDLKFNISNKIIFYSRWKFQNKKLLFKNEYYN